MHILIALVFIVTAIKALGFAAEVFTQYELPFLVFTSVYFICWLFAKLLVSIPTAPSTTKTAGTEQEGEFGTLYTVGTVSFCLVLLIYALIVTVAITLILLFNGHGTSAFILALLSFIPISLLAACTDARKISKEREKALAPQAAVNNGMPYQNNLAYRPPLCPFCGKELRTPRARQCFHCHKDWHDINNGSV